MNRHSDSHGTLRLRRIAQELGAVIDINTNPLSPPKTPPTFLVPDDERKADAILGQLRIEESAAKPQPKGLRRLSTRNPKPSAYTYDEIYSALSRVIDDNGLAGVVEVLLKRFRSLEGNINLARRAGGGMIRKIRNTENREERGRLLQAATEINRHDFVQLLAPLADQPSLDESLHIAIDKRELPVTETLLKYGANSALYEGTFINVSRHGDIEMLDLLLRAKRRVSEQCITRSLLPATMSGSLQAVVLLVRAGANADYESASALMQAVEMDRADLTAVIILGQRPPLGGSLDKAIDSLFSTQSPALNTRYQLLEVLLCGGPTGNAANDGLFKATLLANTDMMQLLLTHKVDINYNRASAVAHAIQRNRGDLVGVLLQDQALEPEIASDLVRHISRTSPPMDKVAMLSKLLVSGASGTHCSELLITAAEQNDVDTAQLLVSYGRDQNTPVCSVNYNAARCLQVAVARNNIQMVKLLALEGGASKFSLAKAFSSIPPNLSRDDHFLVVQTLLRGGADGPEVVEALHGAVTGHHKSIRLTMLLIQFGAAVTDKTLFAAVSQGSADVLDKLLAGAVTASSCSAAITIAMKLPIGAARLQIVKLLIGPATGARSEVPEISQAVIDILQNCPEDIKLLCLLCREGKANVNFQNGLAVALATKLSDPAILDIVLRSEGTTLNPSTIERGLRCAIDLPLVDINRQRKVEALLRFVKPQEAMNQALIKEIKSALAVKQDLSVIQALLAAGADVNAQEATAVRLAVRDPAIMDLILAKRPSQKSLSITFPLAISLQDPERHALCEKLLRAGATGDEISRAFCVIAKEGPAVIGLMQLLLPQSNVNFKEGRILRLVVRQVFVEALDLLLSPQAVTPSVATRTSAFEEAIKLKGKQDRLKIAKRLLKSGKVEGQTVSNALITAVNLPDFELSELLLQSGASIEHRSGAAVHSAASSGEQEILKLLVSGKMSSKPTLSTLTSGFGGAVTLKEKNREAYCLIIQILMEAGMRGEALDAALIEAVKEGDSNLQLSELLYKGGGSVDWRDGEALDIAARSASIGTLDLLLEHQPSQHVLARAWRSAIQLPRNKRIQVIELLLKAGKTIDNHVSRALTAATLEHPSDRRLIKLLLSYDAFDRGESIVHATRILDLRTLTLLLNPPKATEFVSASFKEAMSTEILWQSATGLAIVELMLKKGASGDAVAEALCQAVEKCLNKAGGLASAFLEVLLRFGADVNYQQGLVLQRAALQVNIPAIQSLLPTATSESKAMAIPYLFRHCDDKTMVLKAIESFQQSLSAGDQDLDTMFHHPDPELEPVLFLALSKFPRDDQILEALLDLGYSANQWQPYADESRQPWPILCWALNQPEKKISSTNIEMLIDKGANVNFKSKLGITPLTLAIRNQRADIVSKLISKGANTTESDSDGVTPLTLASSLGNTSIMEYLLRADAETDDGSLHDVSRQLRSDAMRTLIKYGHQVDYPSDRHEGRSALAELCLKAVDHSPTPAKLEEAIQCLVANDSDIRLADVSGKTIFHYALDSTDPLSILTVLLKMMWKIINEDAFLYTDQTYTYSLTKYVEKGLYAGPWHQKDEILCLLRNKRAKDRFWANSIDASQPDDYCGAPPHIEAEVQLQKARQKRKIEQREDVRDLLELKRMTVIGEIEIMQDQTEAEIHISREKARVELELLRVKSDMQLQLEINTEAERDRLEVQRQAREIRHQKALGEVHVSTQRAIREEASEMDRTKRLMEIEFTDKRIAMENEGVKARLAIEGSAHHDQDKMLTKQHEREIARLKMQKQLVEKQTLLAGTFQNTGINQRQIGYITGEG